MFLFSKIAASVVSVLLTFDAGRTRERQISLFEEDIPNLGLEIRLSSLGRSDWQSNMWEPAKHNLAFEGNGMKPGPLGVQSKLPTNGFGDQRASELTESVLRYNRRDQHLAQVS